MLHFFYLVLKFYVTITLRFYYNKIEVRGKENLRGNGPFLFVANHQNAFIDGLLLVSVNSFSVHFLIRADIYKKKWASAVLHFLKLMPVYRIRDGYENLSKNNDQFDACIRLFKKGDSVLIFPEGNHGHTRKLRPLSKGFTRIAFEAMKQQPDMNLQVIPVGFNYSHQSAFNSRVLIQYGPPIAIKDYYKEPLPANANAFKDKVAEEIKKLITHIDDDARYEEILSKLNASNPDYFDPVDTNKRVEKIMHGESLVRTERPTSLFNLITTPLKPVAFALNAPMILAWRKFSKTIKDPVFVSSLKYGFGFSLLHMYYIMLMSISAIFIGWWALLVYPMLLLTLKILRKPV